MLGFGFADFETRLTERSGLDRIHSSFQVSLLKEIAPADVPVFRGLALFKLFQDGLGAFFTFNDGHNAARFISTQIVADYSKGTLGFSVHSETPSGSVDYRSMKRARPLLRLAGTRS